MRGESGQGLIPTVAGFGVVLVMLLVVTQVTFDLYARSAVTSAALDAAREVADYQASASYPDDPAAETAATARAQRRAASALGSYGAAVDFRWAFIPAPDQPEVVALRVHFDLRRSRYNLTGPLRLPGLNQFDRTVQARIERIVCPAGRSCSVGP